MSQASIIFILSGLAILLSTLFEKKPKVETGQQSSPIEKTDIQPLQSYPMDSGEWIVLGMMAEDEMDYLR